MAYEIFENDQIDAKIKNLESLLQNKKEELEDAKCTYSMLCNKISEYDVQKQKFKLDDAIIITQQVY